MAKRARERAAERLVVLGASMGGVEALKLVFGGVELDARVAFVVVMHFSGSSTVLPAILERASELPAVVGNQGDPLVGGRIYVARPGLQTSIDHGRLTVHVAPHENGHRPSINVLFRSAARAYGRRAIGVILSGALDGGAAGLALIKARGGITVVQEPSTAINPEMPKSALDEVDADYVMPPEEIGHLVARLVRTGPPRAGRRVPAAAPKRSSLVCRECSGSIRFAGDDRLEATLWESLNVMQERTELCKRMAQRAHENGHEHTARVYREKAEESAHHAAVLRDLVYSTDGELPSDAINEAEPPEPARARQRRPRKRARRRADRGARRDG